MPEKILVFNGFGGSNSRPDALATWANSFNPDVCLVSELGGLKDELRRTGRVLFDPNDGPPTDSGIVVRNGKVDGWSSGKLTSFIKRDDQPKMWRDRWYVRCRINNRVYYSIHANAIIGGDRWASNAGANAWREGMAKLKGLVQLDIEKGYAVRVGGDFNMVRVQNPPKLHPGQFFDSLGMNYMVDGVMWIGWDSRYDKVLDKRVLGIAPGADAHKALLLTLEQVRKPNPGPGRDGGDGGGGSGGGSGGGGTSGGGGDAGKSKYPISVSSTSLAGMTSNDIRAELDQVATEYSPDLWAIQGAKTKMDLLDIPGYGVAVVRDNNLQHNPVLFERTKFRLENSFVIPAGDDYINIARLLHRETSTTVMVVNTKLDKKEETEKLHLKKFANAVVENSKGDAVVFWAGRFYLNVDRTKIFSEAGLISAHGELEANNPDAIDYIGSYEGDTRVKATVATKFRVGSRTRIRARYELSTLRRAEDGPKDETGTPTSAKYDPPTKIPRLSFQEDPGPSKDHTECCGDVAQ